MPHLPMPQSDSLRTTLQPKFGAHSAHADWQIQRAVGKLLSCSRTDVAWIEPEAWESSLMYRLFLICSCMVLLPACGCQKTTSISGSVTYNATPVETGYISFSPKGSGQTAAGPI